MNRTWNQSRSATTQARLRENPEEWAQYHTLYREARKDWSVVPFEEFIRWAKQRSDCVIGDFGCGEAKVAEALADRHTIHSFDYVPANDDVVACDMAKTPLEDGTLDVALFSLSLMGVNFTDYLREVWRVLKLDGQLHIFEATSRFSNRDAFVAGLKKLRFAIVEVRDAWKFTHIHALRTDRAPATEVTMEF
jgi:SAM-dependent methyltransferase